MKRRILLILLAWCAASYGDVRAQFIWVDVSYKVVLNPDNGLRPSNVTDAGINQTIARMNAMLDTYFRGFRFRLGEPVVNVGGMGNLTGPSKWYHLDMFQPNNKETMEREALADQTTYHWRQNAINIYITGWTTGGCPGICSFPTENIVVISACAHANERLVLHELGHYFDLSHTHGGGSCCNRVADPNCQHVFGDDGIPDTIADIPCDDWNAIALNHFHRLSLNEAETNLVNDVFFNLMSYHSTTLRLTERQLDLWADTASGARRPVTTGRTIFAGGVVAIGDQRGTSTNPFLIVHGAVAAANPAGGDIVMIRPATYVGGLTINKALTLRATRAGSATIGN